METPDPCERIKTLREIDSAEGHASRLDPQGTLENRVRIARRKTLDSCPTYVSCSGRVRELDLASRLRFDLERRRGKHEVRKPQLQLLSRDERDRQGGAPYGNDRRLAKERGAPRGEWPPPGVPDRRDDLVADAERPGRGRNESGGSPFRIVVVGPRPVAVLDPCVGDVVQVRPVGEDLTVTGPIAPAPGSVRCEQRRSPRDKSGGESKGPPTDFAATDPPGHENGEHVPAGVEVWGDLHRVVLRRGGLEACGTTLDAMAVDPQHILGIREQVQRRRFGHARKREALSKDHAGSRVDCRRICGSRDHRRPEHSPRTVLRKGRES